ncbi:DUF4307 domain-containing protein [Leekyejoonella antrihumi]|uniref:DUF4307 domain-containing protein n=1 Tax=Leekyejoonella antrihumi TaxID=1660198 RepID=A0A563E1F2_9MICO|nr:DUF4307 domain-containing protein [Leekyejoonella antrihumi]TWP36199.1 DUF4307 domain-containing protein [Leekyejoonella antrihumi]
MTITRPAPGQLKWWVIGTVGILLGCAVAVWFGISSTRGVSWSDAGFNIVGNTRVDVTFDVIHQNGKPVTCTLEALDLQHGQVGQTTVDLPASTYSSTRYTRTVHTVAKAVTGTVDSCSYK